jgi:hypothetical protein
MPNQTAYGFTGRVWTFGDNASRLLFKGLLMRILRVSRRTAVAAVVLAGVLIGVGQFVGLAQSASTSEIIGVWRVSEVTTPGPNGRKVTDPQPSLGIFTPRYFSAIAVTSDAPRPESAPGEQQTDKQLADAFGAFRAQAGTYEIKGNEITYRIIVTKNPSGMRAGSFVTDTFRMEGKDTLWLTRKATDAGPARNPTTWKLTRLE